MSAIELVVQAREASAIVQPFTNQPPLNLVFFKL
jgi:hypothetical protein